MPANAASFACASDNALSSRTTPSFALRAGRDHGEFGGKPALLGRDIVGLRAALPRLGERACADGAKLAFQFIARAIDALRILRARRRHDLDRGDLGNLDAQRLAHGEVARAL